MYLIRFVCILLSSVDSVQLVKHCDIEMVIIDNHEMENFELIGVNMCSLQCTARDYCWSIAYDIVTLMCHVLRLRLETIEVCERFTFVPKRKTKIQAGLCSSKICRGRRCLETRSRRDVCVKGKYHDQQYYIHLHTKLVSACMDGDMSRAKSILSDAAVEINTRGLNRKTPVMLAAEKAHRDVFDFLVRNGADLSLVDKESNTILHMACEGGNLDIVKCILTQNTVDINSIGENGCTPVMKAALKGYKDVFDLLVRKGSDLSLVDRESNTILHMACEGGNLDIVKYILTQNTVDINSIAENGLTPTMKVARKGYKAVFDLLVKKGADLSPIDRNGESILYMACKGGNIEIVKYILTQSIKDINTGGGDMNTPVMMAAYKGHKDVFDLLVRKNADLLIESSNSNNILHFVCMGGNIEILKYILTSCSFNVNSRGGNGLTPAMIAASKGRKDMFDLLLENKADLSLVGNIGNNILHTVCEGGNMELVKHILAQNIVEINSQTVNGWTPAMKAASEGHKEVLKLLVSKGADLTLVNNVDNNILHVAFENRHAEIVKYILTYDLVDVNSRSGEGMTPVMFAALEGSAEMFDFIVRIGAFLPSVNTHGENILHLACIEGNSEIVKYVLGQNAVNINGKNVDGQTPVLMAVVRGYKDIFDLLVSEGADLSIVDAKGENILHKVSVVGNVDIVKQALTQKNIVQGINRKGERDRTPVMVAAISGHKEVFDLLVKKGADLTLVDRDGNSVLHLAARCVNVEIAKYLLSHNIVDINRKGTLNRTPVMVAASLGNKAAFELLVKEGADMSLVDHGRNTILHLAVRGANVDIVKYILNNALVDVIAKNKYGSNAIMLARKYGHLSMFNLLRFQGFA